MEQLFHRLLEPFLLYDIVMPGDLLATIELDKIIEAGYDPTVMVIDTADSSKRNVTLLAKNTVHAKDDLVLIESI